MEMDVAQSTVMSAAFVFSFLSSSVIGSENIAFKDHSTSSGAGSSIAVIGGGGSVATMGGPVAAGRSSTFPPQPPRRRTAPTASAVLTVGR
jgi:hypothetical protein